MSKITIDGNTAAAKIAYAFSESAAIYPITPSSNMAELADELQGKNEKNLFGDLCVVSQLQSEAGVAGAVHGSLAAGNLTSTFTCSQGLLLMIPNMYKISGELYPTVFHVSARALSAHALSIFGDHSDVMACRSTGFAMLASTSVQEVLDMATVAHISTLTSSIPFVHFFDGFRTSHEINKIEDISREELLKLVPHDAIAKFKMRALSSQKPHQQGTAQNPDIYFQNREACNTYYNNVESEVNKALEKFKQITGREYKTIQYYGPKDAENIIILMGSACQTAIKVIEKQGANSPKTGVIVVRLFRPFGVNALINALPKSTKKIAVLDRTKEPGADGEPLYKDVCSALMESGLSHIKVVGGRYGLGGKEFTPNMVLSVINNLNSDTPKNKFTVGINDDVTNTSLYVDNSVVPHTTNYCCKFYGLGSDGTVSANKNSIKIIGDATNKYAQGYFEYDSKKSGSLTISHLRFGDNPINAPYLIKHANFSACHNINFIGKYDMLDDLLPGGIFLLNSPFSHQELSNILPDNFLAQLKAKNIKMYTVDGNKVAQDAGLGKRINVVMQACFFKLTNVIEYQKVEQMLIDAATKTYKHKGEEIVKANVNAIKTATSALTEFNYTNISGIKFKQDINQSAYVNTYIKPIEQKKGDDLPVSAFSPSGTIDTNTSKYEKRGISIESPCWIKENCIQCNMCSLVCPHAAIKPVLINENTKKQAPASFETKPALGVPNHEYRLQVNVRDCTGCENCVHVCPAKEKALKMISSVELEKQEEENYNFSEQIENPTTIFKPSTIKGSQFNKPYFEFSGACAGCGETPYIKLASQLFGHRMLIANATGCTSIYSGSAPTSPFAKNKLGHGPAWASSLFEDNAEFGYGIHLAKKIERNNLKKRVEEYLPSAKSELKILLEDWLTNFDNGEKSYELANKIKPLISNVAELKNYQNNFVKESTWIIGGDGWAYDIGYGGLDHILASGENVNILVLDTEVYSNTGGQMSKATPLAATAKFASYGKRTAKKDLGMMAINYKNVYVAQVGMGADMNQVVKAFAEAESYDGPSLIIAYAPCINHGINMNQTQAEIKKAVECGYWHLYRYNPTLKLEGKNPFVLDSKAPTKDYKEFLLGESRYKALSKLSPKLAEELYEQSKQSAAERYKTYLNLSKQD